jgi:Protein of unknown function (DUF3306)
MADSKDDAARSDGFLSRWSRRKQDVRAGVPLAEMPLPDTVRVATPSDTLKTSNFESNQPSAQQSIAQVAPNTVASGNPEMVANQAPPAPTLDDAQALTPASDFKPFMARNVSPEVKNAAMKKLFADPHYNVMDMMDIYVDDYSKPDPIPESMLREMVSVKFLKLFERDEDDEAKNQEQGAAPADAENAALPRDDADTPGEQTMAQSPSDAPLDTPSPPPHDDPDLRLQPNHAPERQGVRRSAG